MKNKIFLGLIVVLLNYCINNLGKPTSSALEETPIRTLYIQPISGLHLRSSPSKQAPSLELVKRNEAVIVLKYTEIIETIDRNEGEWYKVKYKNMTGFMFSPYLDIFKIKILKDNYGLEKFFKYAKYDNLEIKIMEEKTHMGDCEIEIYRNSKLVCKKKFDVCNKIFTVKDEYYYVLGFGDGDAGFYEEGILNIEDCNSSIKNSYYSAKIYSEDPKNVYSLTTYFDQEKNKFFSKIFCNDENIYSGDRLGTFNGYSFKIKNKDYVLKDCKLSIKPNS